MPWSRCLAAVAALLPVLGVAAQPVSASGPRALLVGTFDGVSGRFSSIQAAVNAARPGDWVLVAPGDYHTGNGPWGVYITTPGIHLRGLDRNGVIVDGTSAAASRPCDSARAVQQLGPRDSHGVPEGRNGVEVYEADGVTVENLTVCNFLSSASGHNGNQIWFNGGDGSGRMGMGAYTGRFLTASSTYFKDASSPMGMYGIFVSNSYGPGLIDVTYASNMGDSNYYIGACSNCNAVLDHAHSENSSLGYSGTNSGGHLVIEHSIFDGNRAGIVPNSLNNDDAPPPQSGLCPNSTSRSCTIITGNLVHDNNNPNVPGSGIAGESPVGSGIEDSGGNWDTITGNRVYNQGSWGIVVHDFPDTETPPPASHCQGGTQIGSVCYFTAYGDATLDNVVWHNGFFGNPTNSDLADDTQLHDPGNCFSGNRERGGGAVSSDPADIQTVMGTCGQPNQGDQGELTAQLNCASGGYLGGGAACPPGSKYPVTTKVALLPIPHERTMTSPCAGVPTNPWCPRAGTAAGASAPAAAGGVLMALPPLVAARLRRRRVA